MTDGFNDIRVRAAAADVAAHTLSNFFQRKFSRARWMSDVLGDVAWNLIGGFFEHRDCGHDLARSAIAALKAIAFDKGGLHRMEFIAFG